MWRLFFGVLCAPVLAQDLFLTPNIVNDIPLATDPQGTNLTSYVLGGNAVCINGCPAQVQASVRDESLWVLTLGSPSAGSGWCVSDKACAWEAKQGLVNGKCPAATPNPPQPLGYGLQFADCEENPEFCGASHGVISMCDMGLLLGDGAAEYNGTTMHFRGQSILSESLKQLATLGLSKATHVLLHGFVWAGTAAVLNADKIGQLLKQLVPGLQVYKALPVDGVHPNFVTMMCTVDIMAQNCGAVVDQKNCQTVGRLGPKCPAIPTGSTYSHVGTWLGSAQDTLFNLTSQAGGAALPTGCTGSKCLWFNESAPFVKTDTFVVQGMPGVWDLHCNFEASGPGVGDFPDLIACSAHGNYFFLQYQCAQYPFHCNYDLVKYWEAPLQHKYLEDISASGHSGFVHSCFLGAYWNSPRFDNNVLKKNTTWWNQIKIDNVTMRDAVTAWWKGTEKKLYKDCVWNADGQPPTIPPPGPGTGDRGIPWYTSKYNCNPTCWGNPCY